jgi:hypothetical protein
MIPMNDQETPQRLQLRTFLKKSIWELFGMESGFFYTAGRLIVKPWAVVRDYIHGERSRYMAPVSMLVAILIYITLLTTLLEIEEQTFLIKLSFGYEAADGEANSVGVKLIRLFLRAISSQEFTYALMCPPIMLAVCLTYHRFGGRRFNAAEYLVATLYMLCAFLTYDFLHLVLALFNVNTYNMEIFIPMALGYVALLQAFKVKNPFVRVLLLIACTVLMTLFCSIVGVAAVQWISLL